MKKVLVIGSGAREHAIAKTFLRSPQVEQVIVAPGNAGMIEAGIETVDIKPTDFAKLIEFVKNNQIDLTFVGNEVPLVAGIVDAFDAENLKIFGPSKAAAQLEGSKAFMKKLLLDNDIPTAQAMTVTNLADAENAANQIGYPVVIKTDELAAGKGVSIHQTETETMAFLTDVFTKKPDCKLVIEEYLDGFEFSFFSLIGKNQVVHAPLAHDYKRRFDGDKGPNTGGMGSYSPVRSISQKVVQETIDKLVAPTLAAMQKNNTPYQGVLYTGVILTKNGPKVIEYNVRFGDPETQVVLPQLESDFYTLIDSLITGKQVQPVWQTKDVYVGVVLADPEYPKRQSGNFAIPHFTGEVDFASVDKNATDLVSDGGRILTLINHGKNMQAARQKVYAELAAINSVLAYRKDIAEN
ncbi:phosphoribosylamine--glycine ligase [Fructilactobacillus sp. Tb1]|uniref:phosphoribosylamine--glycine ligase n=1 Tax=Fructilactobacillus sp. Tb1 TaxID=3422304 RepID=UPI003D2B8572